MTGPNTQNGGGGESRERPTVERVKRRRGGVQKIDYAEAAQMLRAGKSQQEVAEHYGATQAAVSVNIRRGNIKITYGNQTEGRAVPWHPIREEHRDRYLVRMLRANHRRQQGLKSAPVLEAMLDKFLEAATRDGFVVDYDPETAEGFFRVPRRPGIDQGLVRNPLLGDDGRPVSSTSGAHG